MTKVEHLQPVAVRLAFFIGTVYSLFCCFILGMEAFVYGGF